MDGFMEELGSWLELSTDALLGVEQGKIIFENSAARALLGERVGAALETLLPDCPATAEGQGFALSVPWEGGLLSVNGMQRGSLTVLRVQRAENGGGLIGEGVLNAMRSALYQIQLPAERLLERMGEREDDLYGASLRHACYTLRRLVENLGDLNELTAGTMELRQEPVELCALSGELMNTLRCLLDKNRPTLEESYGGECMVLGDRRRLEQVLMCLVANALLHTPPEGHIRVQIGREDKWVRLEVEDNGEGIECARMLDLFSADSGAKTQPGSAGLGLPLVWELVKLHGGRAMARSREGEGTVIRLELPVSRVLPLRDAGGARSGMGEILTEMSGVLSHRAYRSRYTD